MTDFAFLHVHSDYSFLDESPSIKQLVSRAAFLGMDYLALTDIGNMFGIPEFEKECYNQSINPILGSELYLTIGSRFEKDETNWCYRIVLLACDEQGYRNLVKLSSLSYTEGFCGIPRIDDELLVKYHTGIIGLSGDHGGEIPSFLKNGDFKAAEERALWFRQIMGEDNFFLELQDNKSEEQKQIIECLDSDLTDGFTSLTKHLHNLMMQGLEEKYPGRVNSVMSQAEHELKIIKYLNYMDYFLIIADIIGWAKEHDIPLCRDPQTGIIATQYSMSELEKRGLLIMNFPDLKILEQEGFNV